jgi:UrcA family protein
MVRLTPTLVASGLATFLTIGSGALLKSTTASAQDDPSVTVHFADLDLKNQRAVLRLYHRIEVAAQTLCRPVAVGGPEIDTRVYHECVDDAVERAIARLDRPTVSAYYRAHEQPH